MEYMLGIFNWRESSEMKLSENTDHFEDGYLYYESNRNSYFNYDSKPFYFNQNTGILCGVLGYFSNLEEIKRLYSINKTHDTEIIEELYRISGLQFLDILDGHFVIFIYDQQARKALILQPEHGSLLPVYYYDDSKVVTFSTSLKYLLKHCAFDRRLNTAAARKFLYRRYMIPDEETLIEGVRKLVPQSYFYLNCRTQKLETPQIILNAAKISTITAEANFPDYIKNNIFNVCSKLKDQPPSIALSGGYDSNLILYYLRSMTEGTIEAITVDGGIGYNELPAVNKILQHYNDIILSTGQMQQSAISRLPDIVWRYEGYCFEGGVFLRYCICDLLKNTSKQAVLLGAGADQVIALEKHSIFYSKIDNTGLRLRNLIKRSFLGRIYYRLLGDKNPEDILTRQFSNSGGWVKYNMSLELLLKMHDLLLNSYGFRGIYPFINREVISAALMLRNRNFKKELHKKKTKELLGDIIADNVSVSDIVSDTQILFETKKETLMKALDSGTAKDILSLKQIDTLKNEPLSHHVAILQLVYIILFEKIFISGDYDLFFEIDSLDKNIDELIS